ncbi:MAG: hypothetical protein JO265_10920 [Acidimicrobiia bacterium]|nr:hypothetical protein [Acidimicrobiia bacterium]
MSMFAVWCDGHRRRVLLGSSSILALANGPDGPVVRWRCTCGQEGVWWAWTGESGVPCTP